ncbi:hypothetical protein Q5X40_16900 [Acinetobacter baumannii]|uniref:hypothetical protein n=1 Tax=Acinetobacter calcoaceticus/baumannii complex TaxID=909768 RepID=UPI00034BD8F1|nr:MULTISPECIES: hypothetical protein [Acinetobacter calcoaceticus/baumannii complex]MDK6142544.1 hypothetical protein [Acinetobacter baumannii]MDO7381555.1 hypothetical protein [Acinetobacter baumannii]RZG93258.1 hypothetical protein EXE01_19160 [Acinetobacter pittii]RZH14913.1 hypothetical protein EXD97_18770 [Acinetobacter pittii]
MFDSALARKFLEKIGTMSFEELDEKASRAPSIGIEGLVENLPSLEAMIEEVFDVLPNQDVIQLFTIDNNAKKTTPEQGSQENFSFEILSDNEPEYLAAA